MSRTTPLIRSLKQLKHQLFLAQKSGRAISDEGRDMLYRARNRVRPYKYHPEKYPLDFVVLPSTYRGAPMDEFPRRIWCVWFGSNEMSENRRAAYESILETNPDLEVVLVTPENLNEYVLPHAPLHPAFNMLSAVHQSDYLHAYLMHHHGGGFSGVKKHLHRWSPVFVRLAADEDAWAIGYQVPRVREATWFYGPLARDIHVHYSRLLGFSGKVMRPNTPLTYEWLNEVNRRVSYYADLLADFPGNLYGDNPGYPVPWTCLGSQVFEPLCLKYLDKIRIDPRVKPQLWGHR